jgi:peptidyl-prolyl cis-trans isomerase C
MMILKPARLMLALVAVAAAPAFAQNIATVNGKAITKARADAIVKQVIAGGQAKADTPDLRAIIRQDLIRRELMIQEAEKLGYGKNATVKEQIENARAQIMVSAMMRDVLAKSPVTDKDIQAEYDRAKAGAPAKEYHVRHILAETEAAAKEIVAKLKGGAKFEELAKASKDAGTANSGGDLDWATPSAFPKEFADAFVKLAPGQVTEQPVKTSNGFHVIKVDETRDTKFPALADVKQQVAEAVQQRKVEAYQQELEKKAKIQ